MFASGQPARTFSSSSMGSSLGPRFLTELALPRAVGFSSRSGSGIIALPLANAGDASTSAWRGPAIGIDAVCRRPCITYDNVLSMLNRPGGPNRRMAFALRGVCPSRRLAGTSQTDMMRRVAGLRSRDVRRQDHRVSEQAHGKLVRDDCLRLELQLTQHAAVGNATEAIGTVIGFRKATETCAGCGGVRAGTKSG
jgi:hypothetical protein